MRDVCTLTLVYSSSTLVKKNLKRGLPEKVSKVVASTIVRLLSTSSAVHVGPTCILRHEYQGKLLTYLSSLVPFSGFQSLSLGWMFPEIISRRSRDDLEMILKDLAVNVRLLSTSSAESMFIISGKSMTYS